MSTEGSEHRYSGAYAFAEALRASGLNGEQARHRLAEVLQREGPISRMTMGDWLSGRTAVPMEVVIAACGLAGMTLSVAPDGSVHVSRQSPAALELKERARGALRGLRPTAEGAVFMKLIPGSLALAALLLAMLWSAEVGWEQTVRVVTSAYHTVTAPAPEGYHSGLSAMPQSTPSSPSPAALGSGPRAIAARQSLPSPSPPAHAQASASTAGFPSPSSAPPATSMPPTTQAGGATSSLPAVLPSPPPSPPPPAATPSPSPLPSGAVGATVTVTLP